MIIGVILILLSSCGFWLSYCLDAFLKAEEIIKKEMWEEEKMIMPY